MIIIFNISICLAEGSGSSAGKSAFPFLLLDYHAQTSGAGETGTGVANSISMMRYNPAALSNLPCSQAGFSHISWIADIAGNYISIGLPDAVGKAGIGGCLIILEDSFDYINNSLEKEGDIEFNNTMIHIGLGLPLNKILSIGFAVKAIESRISYVNKSGTNPLSYLSQNGGELSYDTSTIEPDIGLLAKLGQLQIGFSALNIKGSEIVYDRNGDNIYTTPRIGAAYMFRKGFAALDISEPEENIQNVCMGFEYDLAKNMVPFRFGLKSSGGYDGIIPSLGIGVKLDHFDVDFSYAQYEMISGGVIRGSIQYRFGKGAKLSKDEKEQKPDRAVSSSFSASRPAVAALKPDKVENIAILDFKPQNASSGDAAFVTDIFRTEVLASQSFRIVAKENIDKVLSEQGFQQTGCTDQECAVKIGKILNVRKMIVGNFGLLMGKYFLTIKAVDVETAEIIYSDKASCSTLEELEQTVSNIVVAMVKYIGYSK